MRYQLPAQFLKRTGHPSTRSPDFQPSQSPDFPVLLGVIVRRVRRFTIFLIFFTMQAIGFVLLEIAGAFHTVGWSLEVENTIYPASLWMPVAAGVLLLDVANAVLLTALFRRAESKASGTDDKWPGDRAA